MCPCGPNDVPVIPADTDEGWAIARRLLHEPGLDDVVRLAGALIVIYAQRLHRVSSLRVEDIEVAGTTVSVHIGEARIELPEPLDGYARRVLADRRPHPNKAKLPHDPGWLFPGNQPGWPIASQSLSKKLRHHGIAPHRNRIAALYQLAGEIPAPLLANLLGISTRTAELWSRLAAKRWAEYPAMRIDNGAYSIKVE